MEEKKFDIKSLIGFTLIFGILMWMMYSNQPTKEELAETAKKEQADKEAKTPKSLTATTTQVVQKTDSTGKVSQEALSKLGDGTQSQTMSQVDQFTVKSRVKSVTASQAVRHNEMLKTSFPMKHHLDYPDYKTSNE